MRSAGPQLNDPGIAVERLVFKRIKAGPAWWESFPTMLEETGELEAILFPLQAVVLPILREENS